MTASSENAVDRPATDQYMELVRTFPLRRLRSDEEHERAGDVIHALISRALRPGEQDYLDILTDIVERYEDATFQLREVPDLELVKFLMEQNGMNQSDLAEEIGVTPSTISMILSGERRFTRDQLGVIAGRFHLSTKVFRLGE